MTAAHLVVVERVAPLREAIGTLRARGRIGFVPTMGALHAGHAELVRTARRECDVVVASCYVNPTQFGPSEDLERYPRTPGHDADVLAGAGADVLWRPQDRDLYPFGRSSVVRAGALADRLEGASRPGHFDGVVTVVAKLLAAVGPDVLYLGEKDFQQLVVVQRLVRELLLPVEVRGVPTVRDPDGLALSSRNAYLSVEERAAALALPRALEAAGHAASNTADAATIVAAARAVLDAEDAVHPDYLELVDVETLAPLDRLDRRAAILLAARVGATRLIDNRRLHPPTRGTP